MWWKPYEALMERKAVPARSVLIDMLANEMVDMAQRFPPDEVQWDEAAPTFPAALRGKMHALLAPTHAQVQLALELCALDLSHEYEAIEHALNGAVLREEIHTKLQREAVVLLWQCLVEMLLGWKEQSAGAIKRADLREAAARAIERHRKLRLIV